MLVVGSGSPGAIGTARPCGCRESALGAYLEGDSLTQNTVVSRYCGAVVKYCPGEGLGYQCLTFRGVISPCFLDSCQATHMRTLHLYTRYTVDRDSIATLEVIPCRTTSGLSFIKFTSTNVQHPQLKTISQDHLIIH